MFRGSVINLIRKYLTGLFYLSLLSSCMEGRQGYYLSPNNANSNPYHPIPLHSDSVRNAIYINGVYYIGAANYFGFDQVSVGQLGINMSPVGKYSSTESVKLALITFISFFSQALKTFITTATLLLFPGIKS